MTDDASILSQLSDGTLKPHQLDTLVGPVEAVRLRRLHLLPHQSTSPTVPWEGYVDYERASKSCCENIVGFVPVPLGIAGPLVVNGREFSVPIATTEGALVASLNRGCRAVRQSGGVSSVSSYTGMTRAPLLKFPSAATAHAAMTWVDRNTEELRTQFEKTSNHAKLRSITPKQAGRLLFLRVCAETGQAMGMNMISKGCERMVSFMKEHLPDMTIISLSGNLCVDKKASAMNWINNRGYNVTCDVTLPHDVIATTLKTTAGALVELNTGKNFIGSSLAGCIGGNNAHSANIVSGIYLATGQDVAQAGTSSMALVHMEEERGGALYDGEKTNLMAWGRGSGQPLSPPRRAAPGNSLRPVGPGLAEHSLIDYSVCRATELSLDTLLYHLLSCFCFYFKLTPIHHALHSFVGA
eukprot:sb/3465179/